MICRRRDWAGGTQQIPDLHVHRLVYFSCDAARDIIVIFCQLMWVRSVLRPVLETSRPHFKNDVNRKGKRNEALSLAAWTRPNTKTCRFVFFVVFQKKMKNMSLIINSLRNIALMWTHGTVCVSLTGEMTNRGKDAKMSQLSALFPQICHRRYLQKVSHKYH